MTKKPSPAKNGELGDFAVRWETIVYRKEVGSRSEASKEELRIKRMGVKRKVALVNGS